MFMMMYTHLFLLEVQQTASAHALLYPISVARPAGFATFGVIWCNIYLFSICFTDGLIWKHID